MIDKGADVNAVDDHGWTPLHLVVCKDPKMVSYLLERGANIRIRNNTGLTPFECAKKYSISTDIIKVLAKKMKETAHLEAGGRKVHRA